MEYDLINTVSRRCAVAWIKLPYSDKMEWESKGKEQLKTGYELFMEEYKEMEKEEDKLKGRELYETGRFCKECKNETMIKINGSMLNCDVCGEIELL